MLLRSGPAEVQNDWAVSSKYVCGRVWYVVENTGEKVNGRYDIGTEHVHTREQERRVEAAGPVKMRK